MQKQGQRSDRLTEGVVEAILVWYIRAGGARGGQAMSMPPQHVEAEAMQMPANERARLARRLIESLEEEVEDPAEVEHAWEIEIRRRLVEFRAGRVQGIPATDVFTEARHRLL